MPFGQLRANIISLKPKVSISLSRSENITLCEAQNITNSCGFAAFMLYYTQGGDFMEIKAKCKYDLDSVKALTHLTMFKKANPKKRLMFWTGAFALIFGIIVLETILFGVDTILLVLLGLVIIWLLVLYFWYFFIPKIQYKSLSKMKDIQNEYIFCNDELKAFTKSVEYNGEVAIEYSFFVKVYETTRYLFLYQANNQVFIVDKNTIEGGTAQDIRSKLTTYVKDKYIICKF